ncbi:MAG: hypothetical protein ABSB74_18130 [Tepidisphaeraceae bacterium]
MPIALSEVEAQSAIPAQQFTDTDGRFDIDRKWRRAGCREKRLFENPRPGCGVDCGMMLSPRYQSGTRLNDWSHSAILGDRGVVARNLADLVAARMVGTVLPFSERESLVRAAARHGINRFEANLLIAAVQHQMDVGRQRLAKPESARMRISSALATFLAVQAGIVAAVWYLFSY